MAAGPARSQQNQGLGCHQVPVIASAREAIQGDGTKCWIASFAKLVTGRRLRRPVGSSQ